MRSPPIAATESHLHKGFFQRLFWRTFWIALAMPLRFLKSCGRATRSMRSVFAGALALAVFSIGVDGAAELPEGLDKKTVSEALESVRLNTCLKKGSPTGEGHVIVTLAPSGKITRAVVDTAPFANTKTGACIAKAYQRVKLPKFKGTPVTLGKKFKLE